MTHLAGCSDEDLLALLQSKDVRALEELYERHHRIALALAFRVVGTRESAEEVVQETFLAAWHRATTFRPDRGGARGWLLSIVRHRAIDQVRKGRHASSPIELDESLQDHSAVDAFQAAHRSIQRQRIAEVVSALPVEQREAVELAYFGGLSHREISNQIGIPLGTVKGRMRLAIEKLRSSLADLDPEMSAMT